MTESTYNDTVIKISELSNAELDHELEQAAILSEKSEMLVCCYLSEVRERGAFLEFGYSSIYDYAHARFAFGPRKTRYLVALGRKVQKLPKIREALASGKLGWCKASRIASVAAPANEVMWLDSALSLTVQQLEQRIKDGTDDLSSTLHLVLSNERRVLWENALEIYRRRAGAEISPVEAFELMLAEVHAEWGYCLNDSFEEGDKINKGNEDETRASEMPDAEENEPAREEPVCNDPTESTDVFPWAETDDTNGATQTSLFETEQSAEEDFSQNPSYEALRSGILVRDGWKCTYPGCAARATLHVHHIRYRSRGGGDEPWNLTVVCSFHHDLVHKNHIDVTGRAPHALAWSPPRLMQAVLDRRRNNPSIWLGDLEVREWSLETRAAPAAIVT